MCMPSAPTAVKIPATPPTPDAPPEVAETAITNDTAGKRTGRNALRIDLAAGNTGLGPTGLNIPT